VLKQNICFPLLLKMISESWWSYSISKIQLILKIQETLQDLTRTIKREQERFKAQQIYPGSPFHKGYIQSLTPP